ncbi:MAG TPA: SUMF1/EgtB/PvdO family nonheme iron enzyme [Verrucomicrobiae bacterium]|mgnify:CR=1 FL=1|nr:SUMF1/EgtB/PvdO family nonheme iron enzyme [Verrucomicrobiae bacterium]
MRKTLLGFVAVCLMPHLSGAVTIDVVLVGDPGNAPDPLNTNSVPGIGSVDHTYCIGKFEVCNAEYVAFLNAVAKTDTYGLYTTNMSSDACGGIDRSGSSGSYTYSAKSGYENMPVVFVSFHDAVRFVNWLENGQPTGTNQIAGTTETGSYAISVEGSTTTVSPRSSDATWVIPSENEWYKAAYFDPAAAETTNYWMYPTRSNAIPNSRPPNGTDSNSANFFRDDDSPDDSLNDGFAKTGNPTFCDGTNYLTNVGSYRLAKSYCGTFDQGGNVWEWNETVLGTDRGLRGGEWGGGEDNLQTSSQRSGEPSAEFNTLGFRVAAIPTVPVLGASSPTSGGIRLTLDGGVGLSHQIEVSDNLTNWQLWASVALPSQGWSTNLMARPGAARRFWRARLGSAPPGFVVIPAGDFQMGDNFSEGGSSEVPVHTVSVGAFYIQATEVTKAQWDDVASWASTHGYTDLPAGDGKAPDHPVQAITWYAAVKWCNARSEKENLTPSYTVSGATYRTGSMAPECDWGANGYRLPTEAEWEKAARGGTNGHRFPWSDEETITHSRANYNSSSFYAPDVSPTRGNHPTYNDGVRPFTSPVATFAANGYGLFDMAGNVWEWCWDWYSASYYASSPPSDPSGPASGPNRVLRGGSWDSYGYFCRVARRDSNLPDYGYYYGGFRPVRR